jgi:hypothetical protein
MMLTVLLLPGPCGLLSGKVSVLQQVSRVGIDRGSSKQTHQLLQSCNGGGREGALEIKSRVTIIQSYNTIMDDYLMTVTGTPRTTSKYM